MSKKEKEKPKKSHHPLRDNIEMVVFAVVMALGLKVFAVEAYQIPTGSMMPTLMGTGLLDPVDQRPSGSIHDRVLVDKISYMLRDPLRWEVVVFRYPLVTNNNYVKRLVGMPGEWIKVAEGDLFAHKEGERPFRVLRKPAKLQETLWKGVFPRPTDDLDPWGAWYGSAGFNKEPDGWARLRDPATLEFSRTVRDDYRDGYPDSIRNRIPTVGAGAVSRNIVGDLKVEFEAEGAAGSPPLAFRLATGAQIFDLEIPSSDGGILRLSHPDGQAWEVAVEAQEGPLSISLAWWDQTLRLRAQGRGLNLDETKEFEFEPAPLTKNRINFQTTGGDWRISLPTVSRDIHYLPPIHGGTPLFQVPEGHYFMMGDNTQNSLDSRDWQARVLELDPPVDGRTSLRGDNMESGPDAFLDNPRWNRKRSVMTFRDQFGELFEVPAENIASDLRQSESVVPRHYIIGKAILVFLPIPPFSPVFRVRAVL